MSEISVVIPTLNEEKRIGPLLEQLQTCPSVLEVVVSDGGSSDATRQIAKSYSKVSWIESPRGRAKQMNTGALKVKGNIILFLHADSRLNMDGVESIIPIMSNSTDAGAFYLLFDQKNFWLDIYSSLSKYDNTLFTYGDQGLFIKKELFNRIGGYRDIPIMEDLDIVKRIRKVGKFKKINFPITTSARRFKKNGVVKQQILNTTLVALFYIGVSPHWLSQFYNGK